MNAIAGWILLVVAEAVYRARSVRPIACFGCCAECLQAEIRDAAAEYGVSP